MIDIGIGLQDIKMFEVVHIINFLIQCEHHIKVLYILSTVIMMPVWEEQ